MPKTNPGTYIDQQGNLIDPQANKPWPKFKRTLRSMPGAILVVFFGLGLCELICLAGLIDTLINDRPNSPVALFIFMMIVFPLMMGATVLVGTLLPKSESDIIPGSGRGGNLNKEE
ncbi:MAG TPA: hypothetical protein DCE41_10280 [Cytophagales bacterium]|nr:hypothetical protein [Cytophagales bacterium]HAA17335.1 hypothetical protein [Cytophagales bacterium]HAP60513.1 hypothetical protein [Cytophagales bacterium]